MKLRAKKESRRTGPLHYLLENNVFNLISAALVGLGLGVSSGIRAENVAYLKAWLRELREKPVFIFSVLSDVQQVVRFFEEELCMRLFDTAPAENGA